MHIPRELITGASILFDLFVIDCEYKVSLCMNISYQLSEEMIFLLCKRFFWKFGNYEKENTVY